MLKRKPVLLIPKEPPLLKPLPNIEEDSPIGKLKYTVLSPWGEEAAAPESPTPRICKIDDFQSVARLTEQSD